MTKKIHTLKEFQEGKLAIHTPKQSMFNALMKRCEKAGVEWRGGTKPTTTGCDEWIKGYPWNVYGKQTRITILHGYLWCCNEKESQKRGLKTIKPHQINLVEEINKVKPSAKYITTHEELLKLHGKKVTYYYNGEFVDDGWISVNGCSIFAGYTYLHINTCNDTVRCKASRGISHTYRPGNKYEDDNQGVTQIQLVKEDMPKAKTILFNGLLHNKEVLELAREMERKNNIIETKEDFKNKYIDLSNKELNGEVTEEVFKKLCECFKNIGFDTYGCFGMVFEHIKDLGCTFVVKGNTEDRVLNTYTGYKDKNYNNTEEVSIYDIKGMGEEITNKETLQAMKDADEGKNLIECDSVKQMFKDCGWENKKYTIEDLKSQKIAVHLPTQEEFYKMLEFLMDKNVSSERLKGVYSIRKERMCVQIAKYKNQYEYVEKVEYDSKEYYEDEGYTIITLDQLEGLEPTAEEEKPTILEIKTCSYDMEHDFNDDRLGKVIIKYQGKEKVITRDSFKEEDCTQKTKVIRQYMMDWGYAEKGSRAWALLALDRGEKIRGKHWIGGCYIYCDGELKDENGEHIGHRHGFSKDGWEIYKEEPKKTMTLREAIEQVKNFKLEKITYIGEYHTVAYQFNESDMDKQVEIIGD